ncbi:MAG: hypothetical protein ACHQQ3_05755 [Gemmatimonadales bacterium]
MTKRREFLNWIGGTSMFALAIPPVALRSTHLAHVFRPSVHPEPIADTFDMTWADRVQGKFRGVFDSPEISEGAALFRAMLWCDQYKAVYGTARSEMSPVVVVRHEAIHLAMNDEYWKRFKIGKQVKLRTPEGKKWAEANPIRVSPPGTPEKWASYNLEHFIGEGGIVLACNLAFAEVVAKFAKEDKLEYEPAKARAREHLIPGVILQPSGVFGVLRAEEAGCRYILAS